MDAAVPPEAPGAVVLLLPPGAASGGGAGLSAWTSSALRPAAAHPSVRYAWRWSIAVAGILAALAAAFVAGAVCEAALAWASGRCGPQRRDVPDAVAALAELAEQLEEGGPRAAEAAASQLGLRTEQVHVWLVRWRQAVRRPEGPAVQRGVAGRHR